MTDLDSPGNLAVLAGAWLTWRGYCGTIPRDPVGRPFLPRWVYIVGGIALCAAGIAWTWFVMAAAKSASI